MQLCRTNKYGGINEVAPFVEVESSEDASDGIRGEGCWKLGPSGLIGFEFCPFCACEVVEEGRRCQTRQSWIHFLLINYEVNLLITI